MKIQSTSQINSKAIPIANIRVKNSNNNYKLYKLTQNDTAFLDKLAASINVESLYPGLKEHQYKIWDSIIRGCFDSISNRDSVTILETCNGIPCGMLNYLKINEKKDRIAYVSTWPIRAGEKVPFAGKILFQEFFRNFLNNNKSIAELVAVKNGPFASITKFMSIGFKLLGGDNYNELMRAEDKKIKSVYEKFNNDITRQSYPQQVEENLNNFLIIT